MVIIDRWSLYRNTVINEPLIKWSLCIYEFSKKVSLSNLMLMWKLPWAKPTFYKVCRSCKQLNKVSTSGETLHKASKIWEHLSKLNFPTTLVSLWDSQKSFMKFIEAMNNFTKFVGLTNNFWKVCKSCKNFIKFVDWKVRF